MAGCELGYWLNTPESGLVRVDHLVRVNTRQEGAGWVLEAQTVSGQTIPLLSRIANEDEANELYDAVRAFLDDPEAAESCAPHVEDLPVFYRKED